MNKEERYSRQSSLVPAERLAELTIAVVGVGAIGRQVALQLAAVGAQNLNLVDHDIVEESNIASQGYWEDDLGELKVIATANACHRINSNMMIRAFDNRFRNRQALGDVIFCCVDSIKTRKRIWESRQAQRSFFVDGRMAAEVIRVIAIDMASEEDCAYYPTTLFAADEAYEASCTAKSTIYCANMAAAMMVSQFTKWLRRFVYEIDMRMNLLSMELDPV